MSKECSTKDAQKSTFLFVFVRKSQFSYFSPNSQSNIPSLTLSCRLSSTHYLPHLTISPLSLPLWSQMAPCVFHYITDLLQFPKPNLLPPVSNNGYGEEQRIADTEESAGAFWRRRCRQGSVRQGYTFVDNSSWIVCIQIPDVLLTSFPG